MIIFQIIKGFICRTWFVVDHACHVLNKKIIKWERVPSGHTTRKQRHYYVKTAWRHRFDVIMTLLLCHVSTR